MTDRAPTRASTALTLALLLYTALTIAYTWPLALHLGDRLASDPGDPALNTWILWWNATTTPLTAAWWNGLGFWPTPGTLAFSEHLLGFAWLTTPIIKAGGSPALAYNVAFLLSFVFAAWAAHLLVWRLTGRHDAGLVAGLAFGFATVRAGHLSHLQVLMNGWMPIALLGLHEFWRSRKPAWLALFAAGWLLQALSNLYYALFFSVFVALWLAWFGLRRGALGRFAAAAAASVLAASCLLPLASGYRAAHATHGLQRGMDEASLFSADLAAFANAPHTLWLWGWLRTQEWNERELFGGLTALALLATFALTRRARTSEPVEASMPRWPVFVRWALTIAGVAALILGIVVTVDGREQHTLLGLTISTRHPDKTWMVAVLLLVTAALLSRGARRVLRDREVLAFYVLAWAACLVLSLGPDVRLFDTKLLYRTPYGLLYQFVPGFDGVRAPARFAMLASLGLSVAAALAFARLTTSGTRVARATLLVVSVALLAEGALREMPLGRLPVSPPAVADAQDVVLELPMNDVLGEAAALYRSSLHRHRVVNGYSGHEPLVHFSMREGLDLGDASTIIELTTLSALTILIDRRRDENGAWQRLAQTAGAAVVSTTPDFVVMRAPRRPPLPPTPGVDGAVLPIASAESALEPSKARAAIDGDPNTSWTTNDYQKDGDALVADLGRMASVTGVELDQGKWPVETPRRVEVAVSSEGRDWRVVWSGVTALQTMRMALVNPRKVRLSMPFAASAARYVRVRQNGGRGPAVWTIAELRVFGTP